MKVTEQNGDDLTTTPTAANMGAGSWLVLVVLLALLAATLVIVYLGWTAANGTEVPASAYVAMALGVTISLAVGFGLMALLFYSSRKGFDEPPVLITLGDKVEGDDPAEREGLGRRASKVS